MLPTNLHVQRRMKGLKINLSKIEVMGVTERNESLAVNIYVEGVSINQVMKFR